MEALLFASPIWFKIMYKKWMPISGIVLLVLPLILGGCADVLYTLPGDKWIFDNVVPPILVPDSIKQKQKEEGRGPYSKKDNNYQEIKQRTIEEQRAEEERERRLNEQRAREFNKRFSIDSYGIIKDKETNLEWFVGPDNDTNWNDAKAWVESLNVAGGGWRMPTGEELKTLYMKGAGERNMTPLLKTTGWWVWPRETYSFPRGNAFHFGHGDRVLWNDLITSYRGRVFAVRSRN